MHTFVGNARRWPWPLLLLYIVAIPFLLVHLSDNPVTWYDEGLNLNAARTLSETGIFALRSADGLRIGDPAIQTGAPILIPLALMFKLGGPNFLAARLLIVICSLLVMSTLYILVARLYSKQAAFLTVLVLLTFPGENTASFLGLSRQVLGEIPAMLCIILGLLSLLQPKDNLRWNILTGFLFGLAIILKSQVLLILTATSVLYALYSIVRDRASWRRWFTIVGTMAVVYGLDTVWRQVISSAPMAANSAILREGIFIHILPFRFLSNLSELGTLTRFLLVIAVLALFFLLRRRDRIQQPTSTHTRQVEGFVFLFSLLWLIWYAFVSIGWRRYSFMGVAFSTVFAGYLLSWLWTRLRLPQNSYSYGVSGVACMALLLTTTSWLQGDDRANQFFQTIHYLKTEVPTDATILSWDWSAGYLSDHHYVFPTTHAANVYTAEIFLNRPVDELPFDVIASCPDYVMHNTAWLPQVLSPAIAIADPAPVFETEQFKLYRLDPARLQLLADGTCTQSESTSG